MKSLRNIYLLAILVMLVLAFVSSQPVFADEDERDQGGGSIWRAQDRDNYYIARWNRLEDNFRVY